MKDSKAALSSKSPPQDGLIFKTKSVTVKLSAQLAGRSTAVLTAHITLEREGDRNSQYAPTP